MKTARTFEEWQRLAGMADDLEGLDIWRRTEASRDYDFRLIRARLDSLRNTNEDISQAMFLLRAGMIRNLAGICNSRLYRSSRVGTKFLIEDYIAETKRQLERIARCEHPEIGITTKVDFFEDLVRGFGRTALILHGGASFGLCHLGVARSLYANRLLPKVVCGAFIGALMAAAICVQDDAGLDKLFSGQSLILDAFVRPAGVAGSVLRKLLRFIRYRCLFDVKVLEIVARRNMGDITFKEAFLKSGRILNIIVQSKRKHEVPVLLNYLTAPDVIVWSAACASCAVPGMYESVTLLCKCSDTGDIRPWHPSTIRMESAFVPNEIPTGRLAELFNVNSCIVSQVPSYFSIQISPSDEAYRASFTGRILKLFGDELAHRYQQAKAIGMIPQKLAYFERFFHAPLPGDVTLSPTIHFSDILYIIRNPTRAYVQYCLEKGERSVWKRMSQLRIRSAMEYDMEALLTELRAKQTILGKINVYTSSIDSMMGTGGGGGEKLKGRVRSFEL